MTLTLCAMGMDLDWDTSGIAHGPILTVSRACTSTRAPGTQPQSSRPRAAFSRRQWISLPATLALSSLFAPLCTPSLRARSYNVVLTLARRRLDVGIEKSALLLREHCRGAKGKHGRRHPPTCSGSAVELVGIAGNGGVRRITECLAVLEAPKVDVWEPSKPRALFHVAAAKPLKKLRATLRARAWSACRDLGRLEADFENPMGGDVLLQNPTQWYMFGYTLQCSIVCSRRNRVIKSVSNSQSFLILSLTQQRTGQQVWRHATSPIACITICAFDFLPPSHEKTTPNTVFPCCISLTKRTQTCAARLLLRWKEWLQVKATMKIDVQSLSAKSATLLCLLCVTVFEARARDIVKNTRLTRTLLFFPLAARMKKFS